MSAARGHHELLMLDQVALTYNQVVLADHPIGFWPLQDTSGTTAVDISGFGRDGAYINGPTLSSSGVTLNGSSQYVTISDSAFNIIGAAAQSYTLEIFCNASIFTISTIFDKTNLGTPAWNSLQQNNSSITDFQLYNGPFNPEITGGPLNNGMHMLHAIRDVSLNQILLYYDAVLIGVDTALSSLNVGNSTSLSLGSQANGSRRFFGGLLVRAAVYDYALSSTQIATHYAYR